MSRAAPAVALLFDDVELGEKLREALNERGARIVHEGGMSTFTRELMDEVGAQVLVVNLDDSADDPPDHFYEMIDGDSPRVVFNDAQASRGLTGWDRARWARHLAVKVLEVGDLYPPRPEHARIIQTATAEKPDAAVAQESADDVAHAAVPGAEARVDVPAEDAGAHSAVAELSPFASDDEPVPADAGETHEQAASEESENLAAELEALLASGDLPDEEEAPTGSGLRFTGEEDLPPLHDGHFGPPAGEAIEADAGHASGMAHAVAEAEREGGPFSVTPPVFQLDHLELAPMNDVPPSPISAAAQEPVPAPAEASKARVSDGWALLDDDAATASAEKSAAADFGIQKVSAADFLAPAANQAGPNDEPVMNLQLVSMEEAIAPKAYEPVHEMQLDDAVGILGRIVLLGAAVGGIDAVGDFLAALPASTRLAFLHTQHLGDMPVETVAENLSQRTRLPVRIASQGSRLRGGEVMLVPPVQSLRVLRDGSVELQAGGENVPKQPSIDASFSSAASIFGSDALAIVFAGRGTDAVAGSQAVHDRGGKVWVQSLPGEHYADMVSGISAERLVSFSGTPHELAAHLIEVFP